MKILTVYQISHYTEESYCLQPDSGQTFATVCYGKEQIQNCSVFQNVYEWFAGTRLSMQQLTLCRNKSE